MIDLQKQTDLFNDLDSLITDKFTAYHDANPGTYETFKKLAFESKKIGHPRFSARGLFQVMRWKMGGKLKRDGFKYNNNYTPMYVRILEKEHPEFIGFFEKRQSKADQLITA
ncbi:hypothetical protein M1M24_gp48 [Polaribacter phage Freya_1]|uniref:Uncharacterized protein n=1 Tax=Polaribacter phage Freya_1 TaxID=2745662 RepID=A0A8E4ZLL8_9CAUD|nr:hypothetical protein M1M24_gp48 [Polaribacter phage Freya_1]QQV90985.1 hypothetical protein Freya2_48 [Polaribacter phage Freya_2]QQV91053.1 hypothetical protein Freya3_48 [Polaribacter phage Freya_3]QQV91121.1 hypothetical protein Freya4_48 [Polaribacter phage Freya_4]QQV91196.1 hypothetical protein Freya8_55 [Polaribacter phage Freya_8]QQV91273.1 hypothetical protein Freya9_57 [Polaribacter phage Freya_9]QQV91351.1 hypothetical protein Freya10_58 [Polaribacter phage Freya_10]QYV99930.1 